jgi:hypothetical protein
MNWKAYQTKLARPHLRLVHPQPTRGERRARSRQRMQAVAGLIGLMVAASVVAGLVFAAAWAVLR